MPFAKPSDTYPPIPLNTFDGEAMPSSDFAQPIASSMTPPIALITLWAAPVMPSTMPFIRFSPADIMSSAKPFTLSMP